jgi:hypothetical protein
MVIADFAPAMIAARSPAGVAYFSTVVPSEAI